ncbi:hypothetical protein ST201phi2-1p010 [Pseudomonas phage 201phi2-1]|uniref:Uncharacterized protein n=1 Tax=Pseudomonas phage 201phi2-1 TaxID=198110 RepID=B3FJY6_BP201|nr:hypothetical protein ST201phi2-1p010 [Pseudomonas phage 201phi2-1]ABY62844.1 hypothetical protein 201phi2-1p010 [Pseudomonas phage 201phi2-1]
MTPFKKWLLRPLYIALYYLSGLIFGGILAIIVLSMMDGLSIIEIYEKIKDDAGLIAMSYLGAYWVKWNFVYGPQKVTEVKNGTNG